MYNTLTSNSHSRSFFGVSNKLLILVIYTLSCSIANREIDSENLMFKDKLVLGEGNFGKVCLATVSSSEPLRDEAEIADAELMNTSASAPGGALGLPSKLKSRLSFRRGPNVAGQTGAPRNPAASDNWKLEELNEPLLSKEGSRLAAVKMVKGKLDVLLIRLTVKLNKHVLMSLFKKVN